jgi:hypothetical protein
MAGPGQQTIARALISLLVILRLACGGATSAPQVEQGVWGELLTLDCEGRLHLLPNSPVAVSLDLRDGSAAHEFWVQKLLERAIERCASASDTALKTLLPTLEWALQYIVDPAARKQRVALPCDDPVSTPPTPPPWSPDPNSERPSAFLPLLPRPSVQSYAGLVAPSTCSLDTLSSGKGCLMQYTVDTEVLPDTRLQAALDTCPGRQHAFFLSITVAGTGATTLMRPCNADADCGSAACSPIPWLAPATQDATLQKYLFDHFLFDPALDRTACAAQKGDVDPVREFKEFLLANFFGVGDKAQASSVATFCGAGILGIRSLSQAFPDCSSTLAPLSCSRLSASISQKSSDHFLLR